MNRAANLGYSILALNVGAMMSTQFELGGVSMHFQFPNGYTLSAVSNPGSYGGKSNLWECAILSTKSGYFVGKRKNIPGFESDNVKGWMTDDEVKDLAKLVAIL